MDEPVAPALLLHVWLSPAFPVGSFAFSHGLEWAVEAGAVRDAATLADWLGTLLEHGALKSDAVLVGAAMREPETAPALNELALALAPSRERHLESVAQGTAFLAAVKAAWPSPALLAQAASLGTGDVAYPVAVGVAAQAHGLPLRETLQVFLTAAVVNLTSAVVRLGPIGQGEAQKVVARLGAAVVARARWAQTATLADLGGCAFAADIASMRHETQYSRLFRS